MLPQYAVIGSPIAHSLSPNIHTLLGQYLGVPLNYEKILGDEQHFETQVQDFFSTGGAGLNVTLPFKERAYALADQKTARASRVQAANTLWYENGLLHADNTDGVGFLSDIQRHAPLASHDVILLLGAGGAARGVVGALYDVKIHSLMIANRTLAHARDIAELVPGAHAMSCDDLATLSLMPTKVVSSLSKAAWAQLRLPKHIFAQQPFCYDLNYAIAQDTPFVEIAKTHGCLAVDGLGMLVAQAAEAFWVWHQRRADRSLLAKIERECI